MQIKIWQCDDHEDLQRQINTWLKSHSQIQVINMQMTHILTDSTYCFNEYQSIALLYNE